ncbi:CNOT11 [Symbiodinium natans]|uniref:CCR4-NOT transcription complex subunit 11 n=1 Tax=Symbiodinium natans TaxID=878477 RepID=A0A812IA56_9DINO|nr:CNOT11 [Symbiodinium natans]
MDVRQLLAKAVTQPLPEPQFQAAINGLKEAGEVEDHFGIAPGKLGGLVESNPAVATELLVKLKGTADFPKYLNALLDMEMSLHSMEVVNQLLSAVCLPPEFAHAYVSNCMASCENMKDRFMQNRLVRLVCVLFASMITRNALRVSEVGIELQAFCIEFSRIREAAQLFRLLKAREREPGDPRSQAAESSAS